MIITHAEIESLKQRLDNPHQFIGFDDFILEKQQDQIVGHFFDLQLNSVFQQIVLTHDPREIIGHEGLLRAHRDQYKDLPPLEVFQIADKSNHLVYFDRLARLTHTLNYVHIHHATTKNNLLFLNVHPKLLTEVKADHGQFFAQVLRQYDILPQQIVLEIMEDAVSDEDEAQMIYAIENFKDRGYGIALDDFGSKHSNINRLCALKPDFVKLDKRIIHDATTQSHVRKILPKLVEIIHDLDASVVIEGIETEEQLHIAQETEADYLQGYLFGYPTAQFGL